jgi:zinc protease
MIARPVAGAPRPYRFPDLQRHELSNGLGVWLVPLPDRELVAVHLLTDAGAASEDEALAGVAALTAQLLVTGTRELDAAAFAERTERLGIEVSSDSSWDSARAGFVALGERLEEGLELLADMLRAPRLDEGEFERLKAERLNDILQARADAGRLADEAFLREVYADGVPYGRLSAGTPQTVEPLTVEDVRQHHATRFAPDTCRRRDRRGGRPRRGAGDGRAHPRRLARGRDRPSHDRAAAERADAGSCSSTGRDRSRASCGSATSASIASTRATSRPW